MSAAIASERATSTHAAPAAAGRVLPTLNEDGSRRWIRPKPSHGDFFRKRRAVAALLMVIFVAIPHIRVMGKPLVLLDLPRREFTFVGVTFLPTDTLLLMLLMSSILITIFLLTALFGRVWCGWACPQTVYMEFLYRPIERFFEGGRSGSLILDRKGLRGQLHPRRLAKYAVYLLLSLVLAHTFLAYFAGTDQLAVWIRRSPVEHPTSFAVMFITSVAVMADFTWFREQTCIVACPYGRWQSALLDRSSLIVAYDYNRGEPRHMGREKLAGAGDCVDCGACVLTCPTGIDIRDGLQMECIHCTQCADACDAVMTKLGRPTGLIRYSSRSALEGAGARKLRPRVILYPAALVLALGGFVAALATREAADITLLRGVGAPYSLQPDGSVSNQIRIRISNRTNSERNYRISVTGAENGTVVIPQSPFAVPPTHTGTTTLFVLLPRGEFQNGERVITVQIDDDAGMTRNVQYRLLGPGDNGR
jgi:cytochrome c oxidase accessory protein FixG